VRAAGGAHLVVYSRAYCHLCEDMVAALTALAPARGFTLDVVDVDADPELAAEYGLLVPVLTVDDAEVCHYRLDAQKLDAALAASGHR